MNRYFSYILTALLGFHVQALFGQSQAGSILWKYEAGSPVTGSPALGQDGTVYILSPALSAITNSGAVASNKWSFGVSSQPAIGADGTVYVTENNSLYALNSNGSVRWIKSAPGAMGVPSIGPDGTIYIFGNGQIYAISSSGSQVWTCLVEPDSSYWSALMFPSIGPDGTIYVGDGRAVHAISPFGTNKWSSTLGDFGQESLSLGCDGTIYGVYASVLFALDAAGQGRWSDQLPYYAGSSPVIGADGTIYESTSGARSLSAISSGGQTLWTVLGGPTYGTYTSPAVDAGGIIYYCVSNSLWALDRQGSVRWNFTIPVTQANTEVAASSPIIGPDGTIYVGLGSTLYAISSGTNGPGKTCWPMYRGNAQHTGRFQFPILKEPQKRSDANFQFQLYPQQLGLEYAIQISTNLTTWTSLASIVATTLPADVADLTATNAPVRFYRAVSPP